MEKMVESDEEKRKRNRESESIENTPSTSDNPAKKMKLDVSSLGYNRCRKLAPSSGKCSIRSLRKVSKLLAENFNAKVTISPELSVDDRLCSKCRKAAYDMCNTPPVLSQQSEGMSVVHHSPSELAEVTHELIENEFETVEVNIHSFSILQELLENMKIKFHDKDTTNNEKLQILSLLPRSCSYDYMKRYFETSTYMIGLSKKLLIEKGPMSSLDIKQGNLLSSETKNLVIEFYKSEDNTYILPGKKDVVTYKDEDGNRIYEQKRILLCTLKELYVSFKNKHLDHKIGFSTFAKLHPKCCLIAGGSGTHLVCVCSIHQNVKLLIKGCCLEKITSGYAHHLATYKDVLNFIICEESSAQCHFGNCKECPGIGKLITYLTTVLEERDIGNVHYSQWISNPQTTLKNVEEDTLAFINTLCTAVKKLLPHAFIAQKQSEWYKHLKSSITEGEFIVNLDFAENYAFVAQNAPQGSHWNNNQATIFVAYFYYKIQDEIKSKGFVVISDNLTHDSVAVHTYIKLLITYLKNNYRIEKIHYFSDGAPQQFKNFKNVFNIYYHQIDFEIEADWHFFPTAHGKGACDGIGGSVKRAAAKASLRLPVDRQILTAEALYAWLKNHGNFDNVEFVYSSPTEYNKNLRKLKTRFDNKSRIKDLQKQYCICPSVIAGHVQVKTLSNSEEGSDVKII